MGWRSVICCPMSSTDKVATSTIVPRTRIDPHADENDRCALQVLRASAELPFRSRIHPRPLPSTPTPHGGHNLPCDPLGGVQCLAAGDVCPVCCMMRSIDQMGSC